MNNLNRKAERNINCYECGKCSHIARLKSNTTDWTNRKPEYEEMLTTVKTVTENEDISKNGSSIVVDNQDFEHFIIYSVARDQAVSDINMLQTVGESNMVRVVLTNGYNDTSKHRVKVAVCLGKSVQTIHYMFHIPAIKLNDVSYSRPDDHGLTTAILKRFAFAVTKIVMINILAASHPKRPMDFILLRHYAQENL